MANTKSAQKRVQTNKRNRLENRIYKGNIKYITKQYYNSFKDHAFKNKEDIQKLLNLAYSKIDKAVKKKIFHKNKAARKKAQLNKVFKKFVC